MRLLFLGDIVGEPGRKVVLANLAAWKEELGIDMIVANGENAAAGRGITPKLALELIQAGVAVLTTGDHVWDQPELSPWLRTTPCVLRPLNYPKGTPGFGSVIVPSPQGPLAVIQVQGRSFIQPPLENPFVAVVEEIEKIHAQGVKMIFVDMHAETTSEKIAMGRYLDGRVSAVVGTHTHVQTADATIYPGGTAYLTDAGMCGPTESVLGRSIEPIVQRFVTATPRKFPVAKGPTAACGALIDIDENSGKATSIVLFRRDYKEIQV